MSKHKRNNPAEPNEGGSRKIGRIPADPGDTSAVENILSGGAHGDAPADAPLSEEELRREVEEAIGATPFKIRNPFKKRKKAADLPPAEPEQVPEYSEDAYADDAYADDTYAEDAYPAEEQYDDGTYDDGTYPEDAGAAPDDGYYDENAGDAVDGEAYPADDQYDDQPTEQYDDAAVPADDADTEQYDDTAADAADAPAEDAENAEYSEDAENAENADQTYDGESGSEDDLTEDEAPARFGFFGRKKKTADETADSEKAAGAAVAVAADAANDDAEYDPEEVYADEEAAAHHVDYGKIALILTFVILGIFAIDFCKRLYDSWRGLEGEITVTSGDSSDVESMNVETTDVTSTDHPVIQTSGKTTESTAAAVTTAGSGAVTTKDETTTTASSTTVQRNGETLSVPNTDMNKGSLILVNGSHVNKSVPALVSFGDIANFRETSHLRLVRTEDAIDSSMTQPLMSLFGDFFNATGVGNVMVYATTQDPQYPPYSIQIPERATGLTVDLSILSNDGSSHTPFTGDGTYAWILEHAADYGFIQRFTSNKADKTGVQELTWHFRYVGAPHAAYMKANNLCLEEYIETVKTHTWNGEHLTATAAGINYEIYYVPASQTAATTDIPYPAGAAPIISGDNEEGFVVAVVKQ